MLEVIPNILSGKAHILSKSNESFLRRYYKNGGADSRCHCFPYKLFSVYPKQCDLTVIILGKLLPLSKNCEPL